MNIAVGSIKGKYDNFDLGDDRAGAPLDPKPVFISVRLDRPDLPTVDNLYGGKGTVAYRRVLPPEVFFTNWSYVDHLLLPRAVRVGRKRHEGVEEFYYVISGDGIAHVNNESAEIHKGDAIPDPVQRRSRFRKQRQRRSGIPDRGRGPREVGARYPGGQMIRRFFLALPWMAAAAAEEDPLADARRRIDAVDRRLVPRSTNARASWTKSAASRRRGICP